MTRRHITVVDDEPNIGRSLRLILEGEGFTVTTFATTAEFKDGFQRTDLCMLDVRLPDGNGIDLISWLRQSGNLTPVLMISGHATIADAVQATRAGAFDFLEKPLSRDRVLLAIRNALQTSALETENRRLHEILGKAPQLIGKSPALRDVISLAARAARTDARVLLTGESGTGKELIAALIHRESPVAEGPMVKVNCAAIPADLLESELFGHEKGSFTGATAMRRGKFELADGGTLFLDEVGDLTEAAQAKLLRVLEESRFYRVGGERSIRVAIRIISATNRSLPELVERRRFREDLFFRLSVVPIAVPPLRERIEDIHALAEHFLDDFCSRNNFRKKRIAPTALRLLERHRWPGNVRELRNTIERMAILTAGDLLDESSLPVELRQAPERSGGLRQTRDSAERKRLVEALEAAQWNVSRAARALSIERTNLHKRMRALGIVKSRD